MDLSLSELISRNRTARPRGRGGARAGTRARLDVLGSTVKTTPKPTTRVTRSTTAKTTPATVAESQSAEKIIVSNLPLDVNEAQIKELFHTTVGAVREVTLNFDASGRSKGVAAVHFHQKGDGTKAFQQYNGRLIDGKRRMKIEIIVDPSRTVSPQSTTLASRVAPPPTNSTDAAVIASRGRRGRGRKTRGTRPPKTAADLDAEMEDYTANTTAAAAAA